MRVHGMGPKDIQNMEPAEKKIKELTEDEECTTKPTEQQHLNRQCKTEQKWVREGGGEP